MDQVYHAKLGESRRLALPADLCRKLGFKPGEQLLLTQNGNQLAVTSLRQQAEQMREELRGMLSEGKPLTADLKEQRKAESAREAILADASAILAFLNFERGGEAVAEQIENIAVSSVNLAEIVTVLMLRGIKKDWIDTRVHRSLPRSCPSTASRLNLPASLPS